jgi:hypothetical protein
VPDAWQPDEAGIGVLDGKVVEVTFLGNLVDAHVALDDGTRVRVQADPDEAVDVGQRVRLAFDVRACTLFGA